jgi:hypothetical protein
MIPVGLWAIWAICECGLVAFATIIHIGCLVFAKLNPGWTLGYYLISWLGYVGMTVLVTFDYMDWVHKSQDDQMDWGSYYKELFDAIDGRALRAVMVLSYIAL